MFLVYLFKVEIDTIVVNGNKILNDNEIMKIVSLNGKEKFLTLNTFKIKNKLVKNDIIKEAKIKKSPNGTLEIKVEEEKVLFYNKVDQKYVLSNGKSISKDKNILGVPTLINYVPKEIYKELIKKNSLIKEDIIKNISEIEYSPDMKDNVVFDEYRFILKMNDGNTVHINLANYNKLNNYNKLYQATISENDIKKGVFYLDSIRDDAVLFSDYSSIEKDKEDKDGEKIELP